MSHHIRRHPTGFTLLELLIVIGVIGLLMSILAPALSLARSTARSTACAAQLCELGQLHFNQASDLNDGRWATCAYDLRGSYFDTVASPADRHYRSNGSGGDTQPPDGTGEFARRLVQQENNAPPQPPSWRLPCPEAIPDSEMSYGQNWRFINAYLEKMTSTDPIFTDSPYRIIVRGKDINPRHADGKANFLFGDCHVSLNGPDLLTEDDRFRRMWRPDPIPAVYPKR